MANEQKNKKNKGKQSSFNFTWIYIIIATVLGYLFINGEETFRYSGAIALSSFSITDFLADRYSRSGGNAAEILR